MTRRPRRCEPPGNAVEGQRIMIQQTSAASANEMAMDGARYVRRVQLSMTGLGCTLQMSVGSRCRSRLAPDLLAPPGQTIIRSAEYLEAHLKVVLNMGLELGHELFRRNTMADAHLLTIWTARYSTQQYLLEREPPGLFDLPCSLHRFGLWSDVFFEKMSNKYRPRFRRLRESGTPIFVSEGRIQWGGTEGACIVSG
ncbi:hypothetical protein CYLTODRAFT_141571 [Cylindrobasidium torrendii FP15055 ss-10]|uniref:Uncharacterized protein n=1 Tax=Cylindrobasidium torrendii FP15055 ss-10 TaxID=1314674 RepID=A0A0D7AZC2_9AGAR|nr:hypothetical protein CYLTODRAFT_141571 [Cylindrobasidium torrendii FP15055 ss-10]